MDAPNKALPIGDEAYTPSPQPCLRHVSTVRIRNLSPFPARDSFASALTQRSAVTSTIAGAGSGLASDDSDILVGQRRKRRISSASAHTLNGGPSDLDLDLGSSTKHVRNRANSKFDAYSAVGSFSSALARRPPHGGSSDTGHKPGKLLGNALPEDSVSSRQPSVSTSSSLWLNNSTNSQKELEEVIWSRLVETFLTVNLPQYDACSSSLDPSSAKTDARRGKKNTLLRRLSSSVDLKHPVFTSASTRRSRRISSVPSSCRSATSLSELCFDAINSSATSQTSIITEKASFPRSPPLTPPSVSSPTSSLLPAYVSPFHRPSTNPKFVLDQEDPTFTQWTDLSAQRIFVRLWARLGAGFGENVERMKEKEKAHAIIEHDDDSSEGEWKILAEWDVVLSDLVPLPDDFIEHPWRLPANTLILTLRPSNLPFYIPSTLLGVSPTPNRPHSPGYNSDTEVSRKRSPAKSPFFLNRGRQRKSRRELKSPNVNELIKLLSLQESLTDARYQLQGVLENCNRLIEEDSASLLQRESSEREYRLQCLQEQKDELDDVIKSTRDEIESHKEQLRQRRMRLAEARALHEDNLLTEFDAGVILSEEKKRVRSLRTQIEPVRTSLLSTLAYIFPIELLSPPDLLYTILGVPLPIPLQGNDPAPPLSLPNMPAVSEDCVATALGYAALLVHLMAAYLCQRLVYPITYVGSRSLVKDPISAMMGPRMFPLYSKGVDTYRFEYAVFLLNKNVEMLMAERNLHALDLRHTLPNLKNLLLTLTSGEGAAPKSRNLFSPSVVSISSGLQSPSPYAGEETGSGKPEPPPLSLDGDDVGWSTTPKGRPVGLPDADEGSANTVDTANKDTNSGSVTSSATAQEISDATLPTANEDRSGSSSSASTLRPRLPRIQIQSYLGLAPLSSMWKGRGTSSSGTSSSRAAGTSGISIEEDPSRSRPPASAAPSDTSDLHESADFDITSEDGEEGEDEDDRRTVRGSSVPTTPTARGRSRRSSIASDAVLDNLKDLKSRVHLRGPGAIGLSPETEKQPDSVDDRDSVVDPAC